MSCEFRPAPVFLRREHFARDRSFLWHYLLRDGVGQPGDLSQDAAAGSANRIQLFMYVFLVAGKLVGEVGELRHQ